MDTKKCFKCGRELPLSSFYKHPQMSDGHLNKCKDCARRDVKTNLAKKSTDMNWRKKERERGREKYRRLGYVGRKSRHAEISNVSRFYKSIGLTLQGCELHHWNYNFLKDVIAIPTGIHRRLHSLLQFDEESKCFFYNGTLLTTREQHIELIKSFI